MKGFVSGDLYRRRFDGDVAQCGCRWRRDPDWGDVLDQCPLHQAATEARVARFEREQAKERKEKR